MKIKLDIELNNERYRINAIKDNNKYIYSYKNSIITIDKENNTIKVKNKDTLNTMYLSNQYGIIEINNQKIKYEFSIIKLFISDNYIEFIYKIDEIKKFILEEIYD